MPRITITIADHTPQPYRFSLDRTMVSIGRGSDNDIAIACPSVSVRHAEMVRVLGGYELRDIGSTNGMKLSGERRALIELENGQEIQLGDVRFDFELSAEEEAFIRSEIPAPPLQESYADEDDEEEDEEEEEEDEGGERRVRKQAKARPRSVPVAAAETSGGGPMSLLLFLVLLALAFFAGLVFRHQQETGMWLLDTIERGG